MSVLKASVCAAALCLLIVPLKAQTDSDGTWAVTLITQSGDCDPLLNTRIRINAGRVNEQGLFSQIQGSVDPAGKVALQVVRGTDQLAARGMVDGHQAKGSWDSASRNCSGRWIASRT